NIFRTDDFVSFTMLQKTILMYTRTVCKGVTTYESLVWLYRHVHHLADLAGDISEHFGVDIGSQITEFFVVDFQYHGYFFQRSIAGTLTDTIDRTFYPTGTIFHGSDGICCCQT